MNDQSYPSYISINHYGLCLRASKDLKKDTIVATADFEKTDSTYIADHPSPDYRHVALMAIAKDGTPIYGKVRGKLAFCNHSCQPNCYINQTFQVITNGGIQKNQELTIAYDALVPGLAWQTTWNFKCLCGVLQCKGLINKYRMDIMRQI